jgi:hypothetical protein
MNKPIHLRPHTDKANSQQGGDEIHESAYFAAPRRQPLQQPMSDETKGEAVGDPKVSELERIKK